MAINTGKVIVAGLAAGVVSNVLGFLLFGMWLGPQFAAGYDAVLPGLSAKGNAPTALVWTVVGGFAVGMLLAWLYAAMRPRFGPGAKTSFYAAIPVLILGWFFHIDLLILGLTPMSLYVMATVAAVIQVVASAYVAGMLYKEEGV